jgi:hypothetical protein
MAAAGDGTRPQPEVGGGLIEGWRPQPRPDWAARVNEEGRHLDLPAIIPIEAGHLIDAACRSTGLSDFGSDDWREPFEVLVRALDTESDLNLFGRVLTATELLHMLQARLRIEEQYRRHPEIADETISRPTFILGQPRTGTSALQNLLDADPDNCVFHTWEAWFPAPIDEDDPDDVRNRIDRAEALSTMWNRVTPELAALHEVSARIPTECNVIHSLAFRSRTMVHLGQIPSYAAYMAQAPMKPAFAYHERVLKLLQWRKRAKNWVLKSPDYILLIPEIFEQYPDAQLVYTHRDPVKAFGSSVSLIGTLQWMRSDHPFKYGGGASHATGLRFIASLLDNIIDRIEDGSIPRAQLCNVSYQSFVDDPVATARQVYAHFGRTLSAEGEARMHDYLAANAAGRASHRHSYDTVSAGEIGEARRIFQRYQDYFGVPAEV